MTEAPLELSLTTEPLLAAGGQAVARAPDGRVVFVEGAAPDERVRVRVVKDNARFLRARVEAVLAPSPDRVDPVCPHYGECGGCTLQHVSAEAQRRSKQAAVLTTLRKIGRLAPAAVLPMWSGDPYGYRGRARWAVTARGAVGYRAARSIRVCPVRTCPVLMPALAEALAALAERLARRPARGGGDREARALSVVTDGARVAAAWQGSAGPRPAVPNLTWAEPVTAPASGLGDEAVWLHPSVFAQANPAGNRALRAQVAAWLGALAPLESAVELYAGSGNLTVALAAHAGRVTSFEASADAVTLARRVLPAHVEVVEATAEAAVARAEAAAEVLLVDPPRAGLSEAVAEGAARRARRALLYVSCDPATFARDAARWQARGWRLRELRVFDLYPQTAHVEVAGWFSPAAEDDPDTSGSSRG